MKSIISAVALTILTQFGFGQIVPSSCTAHDSIVEKYNSDADRLTVRKIHQHNLTYIDSIEIPQLHADTILNALLAVYNATSLPVRDTVVIIHDILSLPNPNINSFRVSADKNLSWMQQLQNSIFPTGNSTIDSLTSLYDLNVTNYDTHSGVLAYHTVFFQSDSNYNLQPLLDIYDTIPGVSYAEPVTFYGDGNDISSTIYSDHVELIYSVGWGDCPAGCIERRYWKFKVYYDCSVEFIDSYGNQSHQAQCSPDLTPPVAVCQNITVFLDGAGNASINATDIDGGSSDNCGTPTLSASQTSFTCANIGANSITLTATDGSGNSSNCPALVTINSSITGIDIRTECDSLVWIDGNTYYTNNNTATFNITNGAANGCDSIVTLDLTINSVSDITTTTSGTTISANNIGATYQWLDCDDNNAIIVGETGQSFAATPNGNYAVQLTENTCVDTSACVAITTVGLIENSFGDKFNFYPNPTTGNFSVDLGDTYKNSEILITDLAGKLIDSKLTTESQTLNLSIIEPAGIYIVSIQSGDKKAIIRLIKE